MRVSAEDQQRAHHEEALRLHREVQRQLRVGQRHRDLELGLERQTRPELHGQSARRVRGIHPNKAASDLRHRILVDRVLEALQVLVAHVIGVPEAPHLQIELRPRVEVVCTRAAREQQDGQWSKHAFLTRGTRHAVFELLDLPASIHIHQADGVLRDAGLALLHRV
jgi:hypothetical protein